MSTPGRSAIPTMYGGVQFRSRLEARYAAWFDLFRVPWLYEPIDLEGYIPDFVIGHGTIVEVKPALCHGELEPSVDKIIASGWMNGDGCVAISVGVDPSIATAVVRSFDTRILRVHQSNSTWLAPYTSDDFMFEDVAEQFWSVWDADEREVPARWSSDTLRALWHRAGNAVQWRSPMDRGRGVL